MACDFFNLHLFFYFICFPSFIPLVFSLSTVSISETSDQTLVCALVLVPNTTQSFLNCSSFPSGIQIPLNSDTSFSAIVGGDGFLCGLISLPLSRAASTLVCWRFSVNGTNMVYKRIYQGLALSQLEAANSFTCGLINTTKSLECWPRREFNTSSATDRNFSSIAVGEDFLCGLTESGNITCLGSINNAVSGQEPKGSYSAIAAGFRHACAINFNNELDCWGSMAGEKPQGEFMSMALGENRSCALRTNETVVCWGQDNFSLPERLRETYFSTIEAKRNVFCGVMKSNFSLYCWGNENFSSNLLVFEDVLPGPCESACPDGFLEGSGRLCPEGQNICHHSSSNINSIPPAVVPSRPPTQEPHQERSSRCKLKGKMIAFLVVGCVGSSVLLLVIGFFLFKYCKCRGCRVHDSGRLDGTGPGAPVERGGAPSQPQAPQTEQASPVLEKRLSQLASMGNAGHLEEFSLQVLLEATNNFSHDKKIGTGSFGSVYQGTLDDGREAIHKNENGEARNVVDFVVPYIVQDEIHRVLDSRLPPPTPYEIEAVIYIGYLAADCVTLEGRDRPSMTDVVNSLERALAACLVHPTSLSRSTTGSST
ncbi:unnamed protein product [Dovyalis caffra]|uniref:non-specific serine/threonine protein kinase n=1 Tax=Dovyalis caffra TaxID=77055 RepID=A0AAV1S1Q5_9ROSI|nr:unnamed protein product [Dovyalis caffra]